MSGQPTLPGIPGPPDLGRPAGPDESYQRKLTRRQREAIAGGIHPLTRKPLRGDGETCGSCANLIEKQWNHRSRRFFKCRRAADTNGPATDVRKRWPACSWWEPRAEGTAG